MDFKALCIQLMAVEGVTGANVVAGGLQIHVSEDKYIDTAKKFLDDFGYEGKMDVIVKEAL